MFSRIDFFWCVVLVICALVCFCPEVKATRQGAKKVVENKIINDGIENTKTSTGDLTNGIQHASRGEGLSIRSGELALLGIMITIALFVVTYGFNTKRALDKAAKSEVANITTFVKEDFARKLNEYDRKASESAQKAYETAIKSIQGVFTCVDMSDNLDIREELKETKRRLMVAGSLLQIEYGDSDEVITGANNACQLSPKAARSALAEGLKREGLSQEARETLEGRLRDLVKQGIEESDEKAVEE